MNQIKLVLLIIVFIIIGLFVWDKWAYLLAKNRISLNLLINSYRTPELPTGIILLISFFAGLIIAYVLALFERFRLNSEIKGLKYTIDSNLEKIAELKNEVISLKKKFTPDKE
ncbi:MAG: LapA family protein [Thermodesulfobacteriota bacterium]|nr:LapA family protein [Thermodesulfobacteriota bacterium]